MKKRREAEFSRECEDEASKRFLDEQARQMQRSVAHKETDDMFKAPKMEYGESSEEKAMQKEQVGGRPLFDIYI